MSVTPCQRFDRDFLKLLREFAPRIEENDVDQAVSGIAQLALRSQEVLLSVHGKDSCCQKCVALRGSMIDRYAVCIADHLKGNLRSLAQKVDELLVSVSSSKDGSKIVTRCRDPWLGSVWGAIAEYVLDISQRPDLPVWSLQSKQVVHYLIGTDHSVSGDVLHGKSKVSEAIERAKVFIGECDPEKDKGIARTIQKYKREGRLLGADYQIYQKVQRCKKQGTLSMGLDSLQGEELLAVVAQGKNLSRLQNWGPIYWQLVWVRKKLAAHCCDLEYIKRSVLHDYTELGRKLIFADREKRWIEKKRLIKMLADSKYPICVYVGAAHFVRKGGLLEKFAEAGLKAKLLTGTDS